MSGYEIDWARRQVLAQRLARCADKALRDGDREAGARLIARLYSVLDRCYEGAPHGPGDEPQRH